MSASTRPSKRQTPEIRSPTKADVSGGVPPYTFVWYDNDKKGQGKTASVWWTLKGAGTWNIKVVVTASVGTTAEAHAQIVV